MLANARVDALGSELWLGGIKGVCTLPVDAGKWGIVAVLGLGAEGRRSDLPSARLTVFLGVAVRMGMRA